MEDAITANDKLRDGERAKQLETFRVKEESYRQRRPLPVAAKGFTSEGAKDLLRLTGNLKD